MRSELAKFLERTFPGERDKQDAWLEDAMHGERAVLNATIRPPVPVPTRAKGEESSARHSSPPQSSPPPSPPILMPAPVIIPPPAATPRKSKPPKGKKKRHSGRPGELKSEPPKSGLSKEKDAKEKERAKDKPSGKPKASESDLEKPRLPPGAGLLLAILATAILLYALAAR
jgi:hypothetical protein